MSHQTGRTIYDADSHIIESRGWLESYATEYVRENLDKGVFDLDMPALDPIIAAADKRLAGKDPELTEALKSDILPIQANGICGALMGCGKKGA